MAEYLSINHKPWKVWMAASPTNPTVNLVSLYDLLFDEEGNFHKKDGLDFNKTTGAKLGHDIIINNKAIQVGNSGQYTSEASKMEDWMLYSVDIGLVSYDTRSKAKIYNFPDSALSATCFDGAFTKAAAPRIYLYDKAAAKYPVTTKDIYMNEELGSYNTIYRGNDNVSSTDFSSMLNRFTIGNTDDQGTVNNDIILSGSDSVFNASITFDDKKAAWTRICLNPSSAAVTRLVYAAVSSLCGDLAIKDGIKANTSAPTISNTLLSKTLITEHPGAVLFKNLLKFIYVWVKAPFAADYIDPEDFNQDLNQTADVVHRNMVLSGTGDFNRYADSMSGADETAASRPYIPKNSPLKDYISEAIYSQRGGLEGLIEDLDTVDIESGELHKNIGSVLSEPVGKKGNFVQVDGADGRTKISPLNFFDPEARMEASDYSRAPTLIPKEGNIVTDGRIISPTIDEIWNIVKRLISGRVDDANSQIELNERELAQAVNTDTRKKNPNDTRLPRISEENDFQFSIGTQTYIGDPIDFEITDVEGNAEAIQVTEFITQPEEITYHIFNKIVEMSNKATTYQNEDENSVDTYGQTTVSNYFGNRKIPTFKENTSGTTWAPRVSPMSLRELEAAILGNKYNIINNFNFMVENFAVTGGLSKIVKDEDDNILSAGGLYQFHRDYNFNVSNPNTFFEKDGEGTSVDGIQHGLDAIFSDLAAPDAVPEKDITLIDGSKKLSKMPLLRENYGLSPLLKEEIGDYEGSEVFLAADGTWRYVGEHLRAPILRSRY